MYSSLADKKNLTILVKLKYTFPNFQYVRRAFNVKVLNASILHEVRRKRAYGV